PREPVAGESLTPGGPGEGWREQRHGGLARLPSAPGAAVRADRGPPGRQAPVFGLVQCPAQLAAAVAGSGRERHQRRVRRVGELGDLSGRDDESTEREQQNLTREPLQPDLLTGDPLTGDGTSCPPERRTVTGRAVAAGNCAAMRS